MKPLTLIMSAFGSHAGKTTIDFSKQEQARIIYPEGLKMEEEKPALEDVVEFAREKEKEFEKFLKEQEPEDNSRKEQIVAAKKEVKASGEEEKYNSK